MNSICTQSDAPAEKVSFTTEIQMMMFGLGDSSTPLPETANLIEEVVLQQLVTIIGQAEEVAERRGVDGIYPQDILFLMRKDIHKLNRIMNYIGFKDIKRNVTNSLNEGDMPRLEDLLPAAIEVNRVDSKRKINCIQFLQSIGVDLDDSLNVDTVKQERLRRSDQRTQTMSQKCFEDFNQSRRTTFIGAKLGSGKFIDWIKQSCSDCPTQKLKSFTVDMLLYLAKETVAQLVDLALLLRQDAKVNPSDPFSRASHVTLPFETFGPSQRQLEGSAPITVDEIREVLRRFYSRQLVPMGTLSYDIDHIMFSKILAC